MSQPRIGQIILQDLFRVKLRGLLAIAVLVSAFAVVQFAYEGRQLTASLDQLREHGDSLNVEWRHLMLEEASLAEHTRVNQVATQQLNMVRPSVKDKNVVEVR